MSDQIDLTRSSLVSAGIHLLVVKDINHSLNPGPSGYGYWRVEFEVVGREDAEAGSELRLILSESPSARFRIDAFLDAVQAPLTGKARMSSFIGKVIVAQITHEPDQNGVLRASVSGMRAHEGAKPETPEPIKADGSPVASPDPTAAGGGAKLPPDIPF